VSREKGVVMGRKNRIPDAVQYESDAELRVSGRWDGGTVKAQDHNLCAAPLPLRAQVFAVLVVLMMRAKLDGPPDEEDEWQNRGYVTAREIANVATRVGGVDIAASQVAKLIHELRQELAKLWENSRAGKVWAWRLVQWKSGLGYRLSTHPSNLHLHLIRDLSQCETIPLPTCDGVVKF